MRYCGVLHERDDRRKAGKPAVRQLIELLAAQLPRRVDERVPVARGMRADALAIGRRNVPLAVAAEEQELAGRETQPLRRVRLARGNRM
jgi:hypothetical protein